MDLPSKPECSWECEGCILCDPPIPILNNEDNEDNEYNEEESWENDEFIDKLKTEIRIKEEKIRTKEEDKLYLEKLEQKKEFLKFHKDIRRLVYYAKTSFYETFYMSRNCSKLHDLWTDKSFIPYVKSQCTTYFIHNVYYDNENYREYLFCNKADCCCKKILEALDMKDYIKAYKINIKNIRAEILHNKEKIEKLEKLDCLEKLEYLEKLEKLDCLEKLEKLKKLEKLEKLEKLNFLEKLEYLENLEKLEKLEKLDKLDKKIK